MRPIITASILVAILFFATCGQACAAERTIADSTLLDKAEGLWLGELIGNYAGRPTEGIFNISGGNPATSLDWSTFMHTDPWVGDDDTVFEYMNIELLGRQPQPTGTDVRQAWLDRVPAGTFYVANKQARWLMGYGLGVPASGSVNWNMHWKSIDAQITTESLGGVAPGMRQRAADLTALMGGATNDGFALHAAQYYAAMFSAAAVESDVQMVVAQGLEVVPASSRTYQVIQDVRGWFAQDALDGNLDWRATQRLLYQNYGNLAGSNYRYISWVESTVNVGLTTMALLYGQGDFKKTVEIGVLGGYDCDCNAATAGGLIGMIQGLSGLPADLTGQASMNYRLQGLAFSQTNLTVPAVGEMIRSAAAMQIVQAGGYAETTPSGVVYHLPQDIVAATATKFDPSGPAGLVGASQAKGRAVTVHAAIEYRDAGNDRKNLQAIIDGVTDVTHNGHQPYLSDDGVAAQPAGGDYYELDFGRNTTFRSLVYYEGDITVSDGNADPRVLTPKGGYFTDLSVEIGRKGQFFPVAAKMSEPLDPFKYYQRIEFDFVSTWGDSIRIRGTAGGSMQFTSIVELEAYGGLGAPGDANGDGAVDISDLGILAGNYGKSDCSWTEGDYNFDGTVDISDLGILAGNYGYIEGTTTGVAEQSAVPEPGFAALAIAGFLAMMRRRRATNN